MNENREARGAKRAGASIGGRFARNAQSEASGSGLAAQAHAVTVADYGTGEKRFLQSRAARQGNEECRTGLHSSDWLEDELASGGADIDSWRYAMYSAWQAGHRAGGRSVSRDYPELARFLDYGEIKDPIALRGEARALAADFQQTGVGNRFLANLSGKFADAPWRRMRSLHERSPVEPGEYGDTLRGLPANEVRTSGFTFEAIAEGLDADIRYEDRWPSDTSTVAIVYRGHPYRPARVTVGDDGEVQGYAERWDDDQWIASEDELGKMRQRINVERLAAAGIAVRGRSVDGGYTGNRFVGGKRAGGSVDAVQVSRDVRTDIKQATAYGALPADVKLSVRTDKYPGGQAVRINVSMPPGRLRMQRPDGMDDTEWRNEQMRTGGITAEAKRVRDALEIIGNQWNDYESDAMTDYYRADYHLSVQLGED